MKVGFVGLGNMGLPMARNLLEAGHELSVFNRTRSKAESLAAEGARVADSLEELTAQVDVVLTCLAYVEASREAFLGDGGIVASSRPGQILVDHATVDLETSRDIHEEAGRKEVPFLDAPISGGPGGARDGTLSIMAGGEPEAFERVRPVFEAMGKTILYMGQSGAGTMTKLTNQLLVGIHSIASCEALLFARRAGVDLEKLMAILEKSWGASRMLSRNAPYIIAENYGPSAAPLRNLEKDMRIIVQLAEKNGLRLPAADRAKRLLTALLDLGKGDWDITAVTPFLEGTLE